MSALSVDVLLGPVSDESPAGPDLEYDPRYLAAFRASEGTPARQMGDAIVAAQEPDWPAVLEQASALLAETKDLRVAMLLARAMLHIQGLPGLARSLELVRGLIERYWQELHPQPDPDDDYDPTVRVNILFDLCSPDAFLNPIRKTPLARSRTFGVVTYRDIEIAEGRTTQAPDAEPPDPATIQAAIRDCPAEDVAAVHAAAREGLAHLNAISATLGERMRSDQLPSFEPIGSLLKAIARWLEGHLPDLAAGQGAAEASDSTDAEGVTVSAAGAKRIAAPGTISSREDVIRTIDLICGYYSQHEPSSPVPLLLRRARRLASADFMDIVRDLAPDALTKVEVVLGKAGDS